MRKLISFIVLLALSLSLFGCAKAPELDSATPDLLTEDKVQDAEVVNPEQPEQTPEQPENQPQQPPDEQQEPLDKAPPCDVTIDEPFSDFEVVVSFTLEESAKDKEYTPSDFAAVDCFNVFTFDYYPEDIHPEYKDRKTVILMLSEQSKQGVLDAVAVLQKDDRIYSAEPSFIIDYDPEESKPRQISFRIYLTDKELSKGKSYFNADFDYPSLFLRSNDEEKADYIEKNGEIVGIIGWCDRYDYYSTFKKLSEDKRVKCISFTPWVLDENTPDEISIMMNKVSKFLESDYPEIDIIETYTIGRYAHIKLAKGGYREIGKALYILNNNYMVTVAEPNSSDGYVVSA